MKDLEKELKEQVARGDFWEDAYNVERQKYQKLNIETEHLREENKNLQMQVNDRQNASPKHKHNERGAGRKWHDAKWQSKYETFCEMYEAQRTILDITSSMEISRATYYRYKKIYDNNDTEKN